MYTLPTIVTHDDIRTLFPHSVEQLSERLEKTKRQAHRALDAIIALPCHERTFANTVQAADRVQTLLYIEQVTAATLHNLSPDKEIRECAQKTVIAMGEALVDLIENNERLYRAIKEYAEGPGRTEELNAEERKHLKEVLLKFEKNGLGFPAEKQERVRVLKKEMTRLRFELESNINNACNAITVARHELAGCADHFIDSLPCDEHGKHRVGVDYPTYFTIIDQCTVASTRRDLWKAFNNRAFPENESVLCQLIAARDAWSKEIGFESYAHVELSDEMAKTPERVREFLLDLLARSQAKVASEIALLKQHIPADIALSEQQQFYPWDLPYVKAWYKKNHAAFDEELLKEYFPVEKTIQQMLKLYEQFLGVEFRQEQITGLWHEDVLYIGAYSPDKTLLGHIILDLYPRENKYSHACMEVIVPAVREKNGAYCPAVISLIANFPQAAGDRPALLSYDDVVTLFHEFGHVTHGLFGATQLAAFSGTNVKLDFVEMPSQMLEGWMSDPAIIKMMSHHYQTGAPLSDELIEKLIASLTFDSGMLVRRQVMQGLLSLSLFEAGAEKSPSALHKKLYNEIQGDYLLFDEANNFHVSFGHLGQYASRYYCYLWSQVFARDMFAWIKEQGLLNNQAGKHYIDTVISKGGSVDPEDILVSFLGRSPRMDAFLHNLGLSTTN